jgi:Tfp pilus assembly protein PilO
MNNIFELDLSEKSIDEEIKIDNSSVFAVEKESVDHARKEAKYVRYAAMANKEVALLQLQLEIIIATVVDELKQKAIEAKKSIPPSAVGELRKSDVPLDKRYQKIKKKLAETEEIANILNGLVKSWFGRGYRLNLIARMNQNDSSYFQNDPNNLEDKLEY